MAAALAAGLFAAEPAQAASCDMGKALVVPVVKGLAYQQARASILAGGWQPVQGQPHNDLSDNETSFRERGFTELQFCRMTGDSLCRFEFTSPGHVNLWITTSGDENPTLDSKAMIKSAKLACEGDGDPG